MRGEKRIDFQNQRNIHVLVLGAVLVGLKGRRSGGEWVQVLLTRSSSYIIMICMIMIVPSYHHNFRVQGLMGICFGDVRYFDGD